MQTTLEAIKASLEKAMQSSGYTLLAAWSLRHGREMIDEVERLRADSEALEVTRVALNSCEDECNELRAEVERLRADLQYVKDGWADAVQGMSRLRAMEARVRANIAAIPPHVFEETGDDRFLRIEAVQAALSPITGAP